MLRLHEPPESEDKPEYLTCFDSGRAYIAAYKYLCGMHPSSLYKQYPDVSWKIRQLTQNVGARGMHKWMRVISRVYCTNNPKILTSVNAEMNDWHGSADRTDVMVKLPEQPQSGDIFEDKVACIKRVRHIIKYYIPAIISEFPTVIKVPVLRGAFLPDAGRTDEEDMKRAQKLRHKIGEMYSTLPAWAFEYAVTDKEFIELLYWNAGGRVCWCAESSVSDGLIFKPEMALGSACLIVDGQNIGSRGFDYFTVSEAPENLRHVKRAFVVDDDSNSLMWKLAVSRYDSLQFVPATRSANFKSGADFDLINIVAREYASGVRNFIFVSSDSDFGRLPVMYEDAKFIFVCRRSTTSPLWLTDMRQRGLQFFISDESLAGWNNSVYLAELISRFYEDCTADIVSDWQAWSNYLKEKRLPGGVASDIARDALCKKITNKMEA